MGLRVEGVAALSEAAAPLRRPLNPCHVYSGEVSGALWMTSCSGDPGGGVAAAALDSWDEQAQCLDRVVVFDCDPRRNPTPAAAIAAVHKAAAAGLTQLADEHERAWAQRWAAADVVIDGADDSLQAAVRFALYHLIASVSEHGEAAIGARGMTGRNYDGHLFWDADVFTLPFLAATHPTASRAMLEYRVARLDAVRSEAGRRGRVGVRFP